MVSLQLLPYIAVSCSGWQWFLLDSTISLHYVVLLRATSSSILTLKSELCFSEIFCHTVVPQMLSNRAISWRQNTRES